MITHGLRSPRQLSQDISDARPPCRDGRLANWYPISEEERSASTAAIVYARRQCAGCPVQQQCLAWAVQIGDDHGIKGGTTGQERRQAQRDASQRLLDVLTEADIDELAGVTS